MQKANLFIMIALLLAAAIGVRLLSGKLPAVISDADAMYKPMVMTNEMLSDSTKKMLERQLSVEVLKSDDEGVPANILDSLFADLMKDNISASKIAASVPDSLFEVRSPCCNFILDDRGTYWLRFAVKNISDEEKFLVEVVNPFINHITYFSLNTKADTMYMTGTDSAFVARYDSHYRNFLFPARIATDSTAWFYLRLESDAPLHLRILIFEEQERIQGGHQQDIMMTIFYVFSALFLTLLAILIVVSRQPFYWYYFGYVLLTALFIPAHLGLGFMYIWKNNGDFQHIMPMALNNLRLVLGIQFFRLYFELPKIAPRFNRFIDLAIGIFLTILLLGVFTKDVFSLFVGFLFFFSLVMLFWLLRALFFKRRRRFSWLLLVIALNIIGVSITSLQHLGWGSSGFDVSNRIMALFNIANTFFLSPFVIVAFFLEQVLVFNFAVRRYLRLIEKNQKNQLRVAQAKEEGLNALILGVENERKRIARELHDGACVNLAAINMKVDALREELSSDPALAQKMADIADDLETTYREVRGISHDLMSKSLDTTGLQTALEDLVARVQQVQPGLTVHFYTNYPLDRVSNLSKIHLYRIAQELLANVLKHARARSVNLQLLEDEGNLLLTVEDDGQGFDVANNSANGIGLSNIRTRVEVLHGKMHLDSTPGKGTFISIEIPQTAINDLMTK
jgi:signal transduction histidine kinase